MIGSVNNHDKVVSQNAFNAKKQTAGRKNSKMTYFVKALILCDLAITVAFSTCKNHLFRVKKHSI